MNHSTLPIKALLAVIAAIAFLPVGPAAASIAFTVTGLFAMLLSDYGREIEPVRAQASLIPFHPAGSHSSGMGRAA
jgi:hypothetical protein